VTRAFPDHEDQPAILLDGGPTSRRQDSTVLSLLAEPRILREGALSREDLGRSC
jgi:tRNA A37 threonylcarbamoyladenosine synthetase subunit TsaC/SUA5/YrdC